MEKLSSIIRFLEQWAPLSVQESYDNSGLLLGSMDARVEQVLLSLDVTEAVVEEALSKNCQLIIAHHPLIFVGLKSLTGQTDAERAVIKALKNDLAVYAIHTNLDNVHSGVNAQIGQKLGISDYQILKPKSELLYKVVVFAPHSHAEAVRDALFAAGAGHIGAYSECSYNLKGQGSFLPAAGTQPHVGQIGKRHYEEESRIETICEKWQLPAVLSAMVAAHPYEEVAYDVYPLHNVHPQVGSGMIGTLPQKISPQQWIEQVKHTFGGVVRYTHLPKGDVHKVAWCGGSGSFLLPQAIAQGADAFLSSDFKYHQFFDAENQIIITDIGHYENEQFTKDLLYEKLSENFSSFAVLLAETKTNPINYL